MKTEQKLFTTRNIELAATLITLKFFMVGIDYQVDGDKNRLVGYFSFEDTDELRSTEQQFMQGLLAIEPRTYSANLRALKGQVNNVYKNPYTKMENYKKSE